MESLEIRSIPQKILARILLQLRTLPTFDNVDLLAMMTAGLVQYGHTSDINAFLNYCTSMVPFDSPWLWEQYEINKDEDWDIANRKKQQELIGLRFLLNSETARHLVEMTRFAKTVLYDPQCMHFYQGNAIPIDSILNDTLNYFRKEKDTVDPDVEKLIELRLEKFAQDKYAFQKQLNELDNTDYHLMGALMVRYDSTASGGYAPRSWCFYLRDYTADREGSVWRILVDDDDEQRVNSDQAIADIRGISCSDFSKDYRPVYLFYGNLDMNEPESPNNHVITLEDYTFDDDYELTEEQAPEEDEICMHCGLKDIVDDYNDMFFCENCNRGVHQLCEEPPIQVFEKEVDPWYCRSCCRLNNVPIPTPSFKRKRQDDHFS